MRLARHGYIHLGNLRTALYSYLIAKHFNGQFILRIEDTDQIRSKKEYEDYIYNALKIMGLKWDEGPDISGKYGPYRQSERKEIYLKYAKELIEQDKAYYCFCPDCKSDLERYKDKYNYGHKEDNNNFIGYNGHCRNLSREEIENNLKLNKPYVIRQKIPNNQIIKYNDLVYGEIEFNSKELDDQVLIKQDGFPTYNFANVIDDHLMNITHIVRGNEYLSSTPKYILLYQSFNWNIPTFIHLPLITKKYNNEIKKLSKRDNDSNFNDLLNEGYLSEAIINYIMFLGWNSKTNNEIFSLNELIKIFDINHLHKNTTVQFDKEKLNWFNKYYISKLSDEDFKEICIKWTNNKDINWNKIIPLIKTKINTLKEIQDNLLYVNKVQDYTKELFFNYKKYEIKENNIIDFCNYMLKQKCNTSEEYYDIIKEYAKNDKKIFGVCMHIWRVLMSGLKNVLITGVDIAELIGYNEVIKRINNGLNKISEK